MYTSLHRLSRRQSVDQHQRWLTAITLVASLLGCAAPDPGTTPPPVATVTTAQAAAAPAAPPPPPPPVALPYDEAILAAARDLFGKAQLPAGQKHSVIIDPLVDGSTGLQSLATVAIEKKVVALMGSDFSQFQWKPLNAANLSALPLVFIGTFTPINLQGKGDGERNAYRVCFALADLKTGKIVSKGFARAQTGGVDPSPLPYFRDAPLWVNDRIVEGYIKTCQGTKAGDPIQAAYLDKVSAIASIEEATQAYNQRKYKESLALFTALLRNPAGDQPRVHTGIYLSNLRLGRREPAMRAFAKIAEQGLGAKRLAVKFGFQNGGTGFSKDDAPYDRWLKELARQSAQVATTTGGCIEVAGHTGRAGSEALNERVSLQRAEYVRQRLIEQRKDLASHLSARGYGSKEPLVATGREDVSDALDRRIELKPVSCT